MRARLWRSRLCPDSPFQPVEMVIGPFDDQIQLDMKRTFTEIKWFEPHYNTLRHILNTFSVTNEGFGYPQGLNYLTYPLFYVYYNDNPKTAVMDTMYSLQTLLQIVLPLYPVDSKDNKALDCIRRVSKIVCLNCIEKESRLSFLFDSDYEPFMISLISSFVPTLYANVFSLWDTFIMWDNFFAEKTLHNVFDHVLQTMVRAILFHKNIFIHLPIHSSMEVFHVALRHSVFVCCT